MVRNLINTKVSGSEIVPSAIAVKLIELCPEFFSWLLVKIDIVVCLLITPILLTIIIDLDILEHDIVLLEVFVKEFLSVAIIFDNCWVLTHIDSLFESFIDETLQTIFRILDIWLALIFICFNVEAYELVKLA